MRSDNTLLLLKYYIWVWSLLTYLSSGLHYHQRHTNTGLIYSPRLVYSSASGRTAACASQRRVYPRLPLQAFNPA
jgi:hypothetical protein